MWKYISLLSFTFLSSLACYSQDRKHAYKFEQLGPMLSTPNVYRTASGAPGHKYWQQKANYDISIEINDENQSITGSEIITYVNNSPDPLSYLWLQLDQNLFSKDSETPLITTSAITPTMDIKDVQKIIDPEFDGGFKIQTVKGGGKNLKYTINKTMMRVDLPSALKPGQSFSLKIDWNYNINDRIKLGGRSGYEYFPEDKNYLYAIAQFFPRMAVYDDYNGWQHKQFLGQGEFTLPFGDYKVRITAPADHIIGATGTLQNPSQVLSAEELARLNRSKTSKTPVLVVTQKEAEEREKSRSTKKKTWIFEALNVRDFAFASSRKFIWDAMGVNINGKTVMAMSLYPKEGNPLWEKYSTEAVAHTLRVYSKYTLNYPYPVAYSVHTDNIGMEYPMMCFNFGRPDKDGTYSAKIKYAMISVIIHEVGHNFFPMIINSDERQWTWMDEGLNSFMQFMAEQEWERNYPSRRGPPENIVSYMKGSKEIQEPIMTNSEQIIQLGNNAYGKAATALNILRETVMGRDLFDYAFKEYARRWAFKHPTPADFFRTMEDASAVDLDWFWRGWFYGTDHVDISIEDVNYYRIDSKDPSIEIPLKQSLAQQKSMTITEQRNIKDIPETAVEKNPSLKDFYNSYNEYSFTEEDKRKFEKYKAELGSDERQVFDSTYHFYEIKFKNIGGLVMPLLLDFTFADSTKKSINIPAEIWRKNEKEISKVFSFTKEVIQVSLDPMKETADTDMENNYYPRVSFPTKFEIFKRKYTGISPNPMRDNSR